MDDRQDIAYAIAEFKDEKLGPIQTQMTHHLNAMKDQIANDTFDLKEFKRVSEKTREQKRSLLSNFLAEQRASANLQ